jgi:hypothetical protein
MTFLRQKTARKSKIIYRKSKIRLRRSQKIAQKNAAIGGKNKKSTNFVNLCP